MEKLRGTGWIISEEEITRREMPFKFLGITCSSDGRHIPKAVTNTMMAIGTPTYEQETQRWEGLFG